MKHIPVDIMLSQAAEMREYFAGHCIAELHYRGSERFKNLVDNMINYIVKHELPPAEPEKPKFKIPEDGEK